MNKSSARKSFAIHTDGSCRRNPDKAVTETRWIAGGYAVLIYDETQPGQQPAKEPIKILSGSHPATDNHRMELSAVIAALQFGLEANADIAITTDSILAVDGCTSGIAKWSQNGWRNNRRQGIAYKDLWQEIAQLLTARANRGLATRFSWIKGHQENGQHENGWQENDWQDRQRNAACDQIAQDMSRQALAA